MLASVALALALSAAPDAGEVDEEEAEEATWREFGEGDGGLEAPPLFGAGKGTTALTVKQKSGSGGTMHFAESTSISCGRCGPPLQLGDGAPLLDHVLDLGQQRYLVLGWSSGGGGRQTVHALLIQVGPGGPKRIDELSWGTTRSGAGILLAQTKNGWRIGLPQPTFGDEEFEQDYGASLSAKTVKRRSGLQLSKANFFQPAPSGVTAFAYVPPFAEGLRVHGNIGWVRPTATGFAFDAAKKP